MGVAGSRDSAGSSVAPTRSPAHIPSPSRASGTSVPVGTAVLGLIATATIVLGGSLAGAAAPGASGRLWAVPAVPVSPRADLVVALSLFYGGMIVLIRAWLRLRRAVLRDGLTAGIVVMVAVIWAIPFVIGPPLGSRDVYAYGAQGRLAAEGIDVYSEGPSALGDDPVLDPVDPLYLDAPVVYGPTFVALSSEVAERTGDGIIVSVLAYRLIAVLGLAVAAAAVWDLARTLGRNTADAMVLTVANPLVLLHLVSGAHNEALMLAFLMGGLALGTRPQLRHVGIVLCAFAATIKVPAVLGAAFLAWPWIVAATDWRRRGVRLALAGAEILAVITLATRSTPWGWGWVDALIDASPVNAYLSVTRLLGGAIHLTTGFDAASVLSIARLAGVLVAGMLVLALLLNRRSSGLVGLAWALILIAVLHPTTQPWYLTWGLLLMAAATAGDRNRWFVAACAAAAFVVLPVGPQLGLVLLESSTFASLVVALVALVVLTFSPKAVSVPERRSGLAADGVSVIIPTRNERANVGPMIRAIAESTAEMRLAGKRVDVLFVDDSDDGTAQVVRDRAGEAADRWNIDVGVLPRVGNDRWGGLGGAVVDGFVAARGRVAVVIDGDLQHPPSIVPALADACRPGTELAVASRRVPGGSDGTGLTPLRRRISVAVASVVRLLFPTRLRRVADPLSGCFAVSLESLDLSRLQPDGFKILVEILATHPELDVAEVPYVFQGRTEGVSKANWRQGITLIGHLADLRVRTSRPWAGAPTPIRSGVLEPV